MRIVVTTPTGNVGRHVVRLLVQAGERPTVLLRHPERLDPGIAAHADLIVGDQLDADAVLRATEGADVLHWVSPTAPDDPVAGHAAAGAHAARAVSEHGIGRVVFQSSVGAERRRGTGEIDGLGLVEEHLDATDAAVTHVRCGYFFTNLLLDPGLAEGMLRVLFDVDEPMAWVDPRDVAAVTVGRLLSTSWTGRVIQAVHGPADLSFAEAAEILSRVVGRPIRAEQVPDDDMRAGLTDAGLAPAAVEAVVGMPIGLRGFTPEDPRSPLTTTPTTLAAWAAENLLQPRSPAA